MFVASKRDKDHPNGVRSQKIWPKRFLEISVFREAGLAGLRPAWAVSGRVRLMGGRPGRAEAGLEAGLAAAGRPNTKIRDFDRKTARKTSNRRGN